MPDEPVDVDPATRAATGPRVNVHRRLWYRTELLLARGVVGLLVLAPLPLVLAFARVLGRLIYLLWGTRRRVAIDNIRRAGIAADEAAVRRLARESFESFLLLVTETLVARRRLNRENWSEYVTLDLAPEAEALLREPGRGLIVASGHLGNWEVAARAVSQIKPLCVVYRPVNNPDLDAWLHRNRSGENLRLVSRLRPDPLRFLQALNGGEIVALMIDQHVSDGRVQVDFFGRPAWTSKAVAMLHFTTRAPLLVAVAVRTGPLRYTVHAVGPIRVERTGDREADARAVTQAMTLEIERLARRFPGQYMWGHRRWKDR